MAFLAQDPEEEKKQAAQQAGAQQPQQPTTSGGGGLLDSSGQGGSAGSGQTLTQAPEGPTQSGANFVNLQSILGANESMAGAFGSAADKITSGDDASYQASSKPLRDATGVAVKAGGSDIRNAVNDVAAGKSAANIPGGFSNLSGLIDQKWTGPSSVSYGASDDTNRDISSLQDNKTAANVIAAPAIAAGRYSQGMRGLDEALMTADPQVAEAEKQIGTNWGAHEAAQGKDKDALNMKGQGILKSYDDANAWNRGQLENYGSDISSGIAGRVASATASEHATKQKAYDDYVAKYGSPPDGGAPDSNTTSVLNSMRGDIALGDTPTTGNVETGDEASRLSTLYGLLGGNAPTAKSGEYRATTYKPGKYDQGGKDIGSLEGQPGEVSGSKGVYTIVNGSLYLRTPTGHLVPTSAPSSETNRTAGQKSAIAKSKAESNPAMGPEAYKQWLGL